MRCQQHLYTESERLNIAKATQHVVDLGLGPQLSNSKLCFFPPLNDSV